ncbi:efflux RND transporter permease subunit [Leucobacter aridicollis]|uniref:HAE1 family hydrophobic/amphiphilic exporter-1 n=1 Tax=Leucobacter aridicollis TaxID=283878 RepID=A0A852R4U8_9MICO|nr:efflux RND transporter permease subunit [Leucobacter aridicollis]MBL3681186.1 efflux RND transporter permease subunit [Leucobacter aridicollis]NYD27797.1 HAE1 family hydrophobic/amphiphilic exporter-1 [Leucobacter aridicollis]
MQFLTVLSLKNRALIALVTIVAAVFGFLGMSSLKQELMPSVEFPAIAVITTYPGASPDVVNNDVSGPVETALRGVPKLESTTATSSTGMSVVLAQFTYGVDVAATEQKVERAVSRISQTLPETADTQVVAGSVDDLPVIQIAVTPPNGEDPEETAKLIERVVVPEIGDLDGVREAQLSGARGDRVTIVPNADKLASAGMSQQRITDALQQSGVLIAGGTVDDTTNTLAVQLGSELNSAEDIASIPVPRSTEDFMAYQQALQAQQQLAEQTAQAQAQPGAQLPQTAAPDADQAVTAPKLPDVVTIGDVADVSLEANPVTSISRINGEPALTIAVTKMSQANTVEVSHVVQEKLDELSTQLGDVKLNVIFDQAPYVEQSIESLTTEGLLGLVFAVLVILVFLMSVRATLVTAISIPTSVLLAFVGLNFADYTLNMLTLGALTISIGRVVDDSIVVIENIKRHLVEGEDRATAILRAVREVAGAITAATITTVAVFLPMAFVSGMVGELFRPFAFTVTIALAASLLVSLTIVPVLAYWFLKPESRPAAVDGAAVENASEHDHRGNWLARGYRPIIEWTLGKPGITLILSVLVLAGTVLATPLMKTTFMSEDEQNSVGLTQTLAPGASLDEQLAQAERVEDALSGLDEVETVQVTIGSAGGMMAMFGGGSDGAINYSLTLDPDADQAQAKDDIRAAVDKISDAGEFSIGQSGGGMSMSSAIQVNVTAPDQETLAEASDDIVAALKKQDGLQQVESDLAMSRPYVRVAVDREKAAEAGLSEAAVGGMAAKSMQPSQVGRITIDDSTVNVYLDLGTAPTDVDGVKALKLQTGAGEKRLDELATVEIADGPVTVRTENNVRMVTVSALPVGDDLGAAGTQVTAALDSVDLPAGASASIGGVMSQQEEAFQQLGIALLAAILIVYVVMVATFRSLLQPLLLLVSVPFAATGAMLLLIATGIPLGVASLIGVLMLVGIVVTNAIVLIDLVNQYRERGDSLRDAVLHGSLQRLRPIVMTALATILALTPMALGITGKGGFISQPLAVVVIGGLLSSTVLTLVVLPTLYYLVERKREESRDRRTAKRAAKAAGAGAALAGAGAGAHGGAVDAEPADAPGAAAVPEHAAPEAEAEAEAEPAPEAVAPGETTLPGAGPEPEAAPEPAPAPEPEPAPDTTFDGGPSADTEERNS